ncbi:MAG TPA: DsrE family protein [Euzebyales bacterium]|nr:DsrE family protein [Euzebyales bacterium]
MARRVVSILTAAPAAMSPHDPVLEANVYAVAEDVDLTVLLRGVAIEYAAASGAVPEARLAGVPLPNARCARDLRGLLESGVLVYVDAVSAAHQGLDADALISGVTIADAAEQSELLRTADAVLHW